MGKLFRGLLFWVLFLGVFWLAGDRYGAPGWLTNVTNQGFAFAETQVSSLWETAFGEAPTDKDTSEEAAEEKTDDEVSEPSSQPSEPAASAPSSSGGIAENADLRINDAGLDIIKKSEGLRLEAYSSGGREYIGYAHQLKPGDPRKITEAQAEALLREDVRSAEDGVRKILTRPATENQFSAMVSLAYNLGVGGFGRSQVPAKFNKGDIQGAADAFRNHNRGGGRVIEHLTKRREEERTLFLTP